MTEISDEAVRAFWSAYSPDIGRNDGSVRNALRAALPHLCGAEVDAALRERMAQAAEIAWKKCAGGAQVWWRAAVDAVLALVPLVPAHRDGAQEWSNADVQRMVLAARDYLAHSMQNTTARRIGDRSERDDLEAALATSQKDPTPDPRLAAVAAWRDAWMNSAKAVFAAVAGTPRATDAGIIALHSLLSDLLTRVAALERGR